MHILLVFFVGYVAPNPEFDARTDQRFASHRASHGSAAGASTSSSQGYYHSNFQSLEGAIHGNDVVLHIDDTGFDLKSAQMTSSTLYHCRFRIQPNIIKSRIKGLRPSKAACSLFYAPC